MKLRFEQVIDASIENVWAMFDNPDYMPRWQHNLKAHVQKSGVSGQRGSVAELIYDENGRKVVMTETVTERREPDLLAGTYDSAHATMNIVNHFEKIDERTTRWVGYCNFRFKGLMKIIGPLIRGNIRKRTEADMGRFKLMVETEVANS